MRRTRAAHVYVCDTWQARLGARPQWLQSLTSFPFFTSQHHLSPRSAVNAYGPASDPEVTLLSRIRNLLLARVWPTSVLLLGSIVSLMTLLVVFTKLQDGETRCEAR